MELLLGGILVLGLALFFMWANKKTRSNHARFGREEVVAALEEIVSESSKGHDEWDLFLGWPIDDPYYESVRQRCLKIVEECPPQHPKEDISKEGFQRIAAILHEIQTR